MAKKKPTFEESLYRLEEIVEKLEGEETPLDEAIKLYEEGTGLATACRDALEKAELKVRSLRSTADGPDSEEDFPAEP